MKIYLKGKPHWHELGGKTQYISLEKLKTTQVKFPELQIFMDTKKNKQHKHEKVFFSFPPFFPIIYYF